MALAPTTTTEGNTMASWWTVSTSATAYSSWFSSLSGARSSEEVARKAQETVFAYDDLFFKAKRIDACLSQRPVDLWELRELALSKGGLLESRFRKRAWPLLVGLEGGVATPTSTTTNRSSTTPAGNQRTTSTPSSLSSTAMLSPLTVASPKNTSSFSFSKTDTSSIQAPPFPASSALGEEKKTDSHEASLDMIRRDVHRSVVFRYNKYDATMNMSMNMNMNASSSTMLDLDETTSVTSVLTTPMYASDRLAQVLEQVIQSSQQQQQQQQPQPQQHAPTTNKREPYHYYQGLHDVAGVIMHQLDYNTRLGTPILKRLAQSHWRDALRDNFGNLTWILNHLFLPLLEQVQPHVHYQLYVAQVEMSNLVLPWMITWFTHDVFDVETGGCLVDAFMVGHPLLPFYLGVALLAHPLLRTEILESDVHDPASLYLQLKELPKCIVADSRLGQALHGHSEDNTTTTTTTTTTGNTTTIRPKIPVQELLDDALSILRQYPPRSLLDLVDERVLIRPEVLQKAGSISMFKAVSSWSVLSGSYSSQPASFPISSPLDPSYRYVRAKLAVGVPLLSESIGATKCWESPRWGSRRFVLKEREERRRKRRTPKAFLRRLRKYIFGGK